VPKNYNFDFLFFLRKYLTKERFIKPDSPFVYKRLEILEEVSKKLARDVFFFSYVLLNDFLDKNKANF